MVPHQMVEIDLKNLATQLISDSEQMAVFTHHLAEAIGGFPSNTMTVKAQMLAEHGDSASIALVAGYYAIGFAKAKEMQEDGHEPV